MIQIEDHAASVSGAKTERKALRLKLAVRDTIERAAACAGMDASTFITSAAYRAAQEVEAAQHRTAINHGAFDAFSAALEEPGRRNDALADLFAQRGALLADE